MLMGRIRHAPLSQTKSLLVNNELVWRGLQLANTLAYLLSCKLQRKRFYNTIEIGTKINYTVESFIASGCGQFDRR